MFPKAIDPRKTLAALVAGLLAISLHAGAATTGTGTAGADLGQLIEITVSDGTISTLTASPTSGSEVVAYSTVDALTFSNAKSNVQSLWDFNPSATFTYDKDGTQSTTSVSYQGTSSTLTDLLYLTQAGAGKFTPWKVVTATDLSAETTGWTKHADCGASVYKGSLSVPHYTNAGVAQSATTYYYEVCDTSTEIYLGATKDLSAGDKAIIYSQASAGSSATAANYEVTIQGNDYVFYSAASASSVTLRQGAHIDLGTSSNTGSAYALFKLPDGFPAGTFSVTWTATATDIVS